MSELRALLVTPLSGPLAHFGRSAATALELWATEAVDLPVPFRRARVVLQDLRPDPAAAVRRGLAERPHLVFGPYGSGPTLELLGATARAVWNHGGAISTIRWPSFPGAVNVLSPAASYFHGILEAVRSVEPEQGLHVAILHGSSGFAADVARGAVDSATRLGFKTSAIPFSRGEAARAAASVPVADYLLVAGHFEDELAVARTLLGRKWRAAGFVAAGVDEILDSLGPARDGLLGPAQWVAAAAPLPNEGPDARWFERRYQSVTGSAPPYPAAQAIAAGIVAARCLRETKAPDDAALVAAARELACRTLYGEFRLDPATGLQVGHEVLTVQWQGGKRRIVWPPARAERPLAYPRA